MFNYIICVNKNKKIIVIDVECDEKYSPDIGYELDWFADWETNNKDLMKDNDIFFDENKAFKEPGIYKVYGYDTSCSTPDGYIESYNVDRIEKIQKISY
ncbi:MAG: hypothetical protein ACRDD7_06745 [Peptostreptococcaceae bacterium]